MPMSMSMSTHVNTNINADVSVKNEMKGKPPSGSDFWATVQLGYGLRKALKKIWDSVLNKGVGVWEP